MTQKFRASPLHRKRSSDGRRSDCFSWFRRRNTLLLSCLWFLLVNLWIQKWHHQQQHNEWNCTSAVAQDPVASLPTKHSSDSVRSVCKDCFEVTDSEGNLCGDLLHNSLARIQLELGQLAAPLNNKQHVDTSVCEKLCNQCNTTSFERVYFQHDTVAPSFRESRSHFLQSIPRSFRLPVEAVNDLDAYYQQYPDRRYPHNISLFEYNPTVVTIPPGQRPSPDEMYLVSYRVTAFQYCFKHPKAKQVFDLHRSVNVDDDNSKIEEENGLPPLEGLVALATLRSDWTIVAETVVDVRQVFPRMQDPRLFVLNDGVLHLASYEYVVPFWLRHPPPTEPVVRLDNFWNSTFFIRPTQTHESLSIFMRNEPSCCMSNTCKKGKNFNYFTGPSLAASTNHAFVETNPMEPRVVEIIDLNRPCSKQQIDDSDEDRPQVFQNHWSPRSSFETIDSLVLAGTGYTVKQVLSEERGTACCASLTVAGNTYFVGISHSKSRRVPEISQYITGRQYFSRFYAFQPMAPYQIVAVSGSFCLGLPKEQDIESNYFNSLAQGQLFRMGKDLACPKISFASGITDLGEDVLLSYGINDCTGRLARVSKIELVRMLFHP